MKLNIQDIPWPKVLAESVGVGIKPVRCCRINGWMHCILAVEMGLLHLSLSHPRRYPTWDEIKAVRYTLLPDEKTFAILFPPMAQYVNLHPNCFHLHEVPEMHERMGGRILIP